MNSILLFNQKTVELHQKKLTWARTGNLSSIKGGPSAEDSGPFPWGDLNVHKYGYPKDGIYFIQKEEKKI